VAKLGGRARIWARIGDDAAGRQYLEDMQAAGVDVSQVRRVAGHRTAISTILVDRAGQCLVVPYYDPALDSSPDWLPLDEVAGFGAALADTRWPDGAAALLRAAQDGERPAVLDADIAPPAVLMRLVPLATHALFSQAGLALYTDARDIEAGLRAAARRTRAMVGTTAGEHGFYWLEGDALRHVPAPRVAAIDTLAAGDVFHGAFALMLTEGRSIAEAARFACVAASLKCTRFGGRLGAPTRAAVEAAMATP
jgi:sulfofructose kinase